MALKYSSKLNGKRVLVIGGTSGIGFAVAEASVEFGAFVTVASSRQAKVDQAIERLVAAYPEAKDRVAGHACDLASPTSEDNLKALFEFATKGGSLDHVVFTAGDSFSKSELQDVTSESVQKAGQVRNVGLLLTAKLATKYVTPSAKSSLTFTGGVMTIKPAPGWSVRTSIGGKESLAKALAVDLSPVRVNCVVPGAIVTEFWDSFGEEVKQKMIGGFTEKTLTKSLGQPEDTAEAYLYFMKDAFVTGASVVTDGGYVLV